MLYSRRMDQLEPHAIPGTLNAEQPLFSPDGQWLAFETNDQERKVRLDGSAPVTIAEGGSDNGVAWTTGDVLVRGSTGPVHGLSHVSVAGGDPLPLTLPDSSQGELDHLWPVALPDGRTIVFTVWTGALASARLAITSLDDGIVTDLGLKGIRPLAVLDDALVYVQADGAVMAVQLDVRHARVEGKPIPVLDPVHRDRRQQRKLRDLHLPGRSTADGAGEQPLSLGLGRGATGHRSGSAGKSATSSSPASRPTGVGSQC